MMARISDQCWSLLCIPQAFQLCRKTKARLDSICQKQWSPSIKVASGRILRRLSQIKSLPQAETSLFILGELFDLNIAAIGPGSFNAFNMAADYQVPHHAADPGLWHGFRSGLISMPTPSRTQHRDAYTGCATSTVAVRLTFDDDGYHQSWEDFEKSIEPQRPLDPKSPSTYARDQICESIL